MVGLVLRIEDSKMKTERRHRVEAYLEEVVEVEPLLEIGLQID